MANNNVGWIKWYRKAEQNDVLKDKCFDKHHAFQYLVERANTEPVDIPIGKTVLHLKRGQFHTSIKKLAEEWNWSEGKVRRFCNMLAGAHMIKISSNKSGSTITIENYTKYQGKRRTNDSTNEIDDGRRTNRHTNRHTDDSTGGSTESIEKYTTNSNLRRTYDSTCDNTDDSTGGRQIKNKKKYKEKKETPDRAKGAPGSKNDGPPMGPPDKLPTRSEAGT